MYKILRIPLFYFRMLLDYIIDSVFSLYWEKEKISIPDLERKHAFLAESATTLARKIRCKELTSEDLVRAVIDRINQVNPIVNAVVSQRFEEAISEAKEVDTLIAAGLSEDDFKTKPFLGVPFTAKECQSIKGLTLTLGMRCRQYEITDEDGEAIVRLKAAGAICIAATNLPELLFWQETRNPVYGMTRNPHHTGRTVGGSSGGEAALSSSYASPISLCSDIGGSTRMPAFYCGLFGYHPTPGNTDMRGVVYRKGTEETMASLGFLSKHVEDLAPLTNIIAGDKSCNLNLDRNVDIRKIKFYFMDQSDDVLVSGVKSELRNAMKRVLSNIAQKVTTKDNSPQPYYHKGFNSMYKLWNYATTLEPENFSWLFANRKGKAVGWQEFLLKIFFLSDRSLYLILRLVEEQYFPKPDPRKMERLLSDFKKDLFSKLGDNGVLVMPSAPHPAPYHYTAFLRPFNFSYWAIINALKCPAVQVPIGVNGDGLPLGLQVVAAPQNDALCLAVAKYLDKEFGGAVTACKVLP